MGKRSNKKPVAIVAPAGKAKTEAGVIIGIPAYERMMVRTAMCLAVASRGLKELRDIRTVTGTYLHQNRELLLQQACDTPDVTHLMFLDTDLMFPADGIQKLLAHDKDIVGANYNQRNQKQLIERGCLTATVKPFGHKGSEVEVPDHLFKVRAIATGFMLIRTDAIRDMPKPWFFFAEEEDGDLIGEDIFFCDRAREYGVEVWCDPTIPVGHIGEWVY